MILPLLVFPALAFIAWMPTVKGNHLPVSVPGGSMVPRYVLQLLISEKSQNC
jgi:hypothetical protein